MINSLVQPSLYLLVFTAGLLTFIQINNRLILPLRKTALRSILTWLAGVVLLILPFLLFWLNYSKLMLIISGPLLLLCLAIELNARKKRANLKVDGVVEDVLFENKGTFSGLFLNTSEHIVVRRYKSVVTQWSGPCLRIIPQLPQHNFLFLNIC
jgi:hypothetical protein